MKAEVKAIFYIRVDNNEQAIINVLQSVGNQRIESQRALEHIFVDKFSESMQTIAHHFYQDEIALRIEEFKHHLFNIIGTDLNGFILDDIAIEYINPLKNSGETTTTDAYRKYEEQLSEIKKTAQKTENELHNEKEKHRKTQNKLNRAIQKLKLLGIDNFDAI